MGADGHHDWRGAAASLLDWWREAGVDTLVADAARDWLAPTPIVPPAPVAPVVALDAPPGDWAAFVAWRGGDRVPEHRWPGDWVAASGPARAALMVMGDCPDRDDGGDGVLIGGEAGRLFDRMLAAIGLTRAEIHLAAVCGKRPTAGRVPPADEARLAAIARHHVALVAPRALLLLSNAASRAVLETDVASARGRSHVLNHSLAESGQPTRVVASFHPRFLLDKPAAKAAAWADLRALRRLLRE